MPRIFISYSRVDRPFVAELSGRLRRIYGLDQVWFDEGLHGGDVWWQEILRQIARCDIFIYMISRDSIESETCLAELTEARRLRKFVLPVLVRARTQIPPDLSVLQYVDMSAGITVDNITDLEAAINGLSGDIPQMQPKPLVPEPASRPSVPVQEERRPKSAAPRRFRLIAGLALILLAAAVTALVLPSLNLPAVELPLTAAPTVRPRPPATAAQAARRTPSPSAPPSDEALFDLAWHGVQHNAEWSPLDTRGGVEMVLVPAGCFTMGSTADQIAQVLDRQAPELRADDFANEQPAGRVCFDAPFWIDRYEVTNAQFKELHGVAARHDRPSAPQQPMVQITWLEARDFCESRQARLPTEAEWEYAARGPDNLVYPWGNAFTTDRAVINITARNGLADVGSQPDGASWVGAYDLSGNAWEWVSTAYDSDESSGEFPYPYDAQDGREDQERRTVFRVLRGGSWKTADIQSRAAARGWSTDYQTSGDLGFRCARDE